MARIVVTEDDALQWQVLPDEYAKYDYYYKLEVTDEEHAWIEQTVAEGRKLQDYLEERMTKFYAERQKEREAQS
jgi:hypothetical protein